MTYKVNDDDDIDEKDNVCALFDVCGGCVSGGGADDAESTSHTHSSPTQSAQAHQ